MQIIRETFTKNSWFEFSTIEQLANIGCDVEMAIHWWHKGDQLQSNDAVEKALELLELTIIDPKNVKRLREITGVKALLLDDFRGNNEYQSVHSSLKCDYLSAKRLGGWPKT